MGQTGGVTLRLEGVGKRYVSSAVSVDALQDINLVVEPGDYISVSGRSGSGKSTLLAILGCLEPPSSGRYLIDGISTQNLDDVRRSRLRARTFGFVFQRFHLLPDLSVIRNVMLPMSYGPFPRSQHPQRASELLELVGLTHRLTQRGSQLSGGEQQRVAIARALANDPDVVLADEPTGNLDSSTRNEVMALLEDVAKRGRTLIVSSHDLDVLVRAPRHVVLNDGKIVEDPPRIDHEAGSRSSG